MRDMSPAVFSAVLERLHALSLRTIDIIGGEPTLHPEIVSFVEAAVSSGFAVNISSNGTNIAVLERIMQTARNARIGISVNDRPTLQAMAPFIRRADPAVKTVFHGQLDSRLVDDIIGLKPSTFFLIYRDAAGPNDLRETVPFSQFLRDVRVRFRQAGTVYCPGFLPDCENEPELAAVRCPAGTTKLGIMPDGSVYPCNLLFGRHEFMLGNIISDPFERIWHHRALAFFRAPVENRCGIRDCEFHARCHGGCPAQSLLLSGDLAAPDPRCISPRQD